VRAIDKGRKRSGKHLGARRQFTADKKVWDLLDKAAIAHANRSCADWAIRCLIVCAAYELQMDLEHCLSLASMKLSERKK
jgi:hypothetical protein